MPELATIATAIEAVKVGPSLSAGSFIRPTHHHVGDTTRSFFVKSRSKILIQDGLQDSSFIIYRAMASLSLVEHSSICRSAIDELDPLSKEASGHHSEIHSLDTQRPTQDELTHRQY